MKATSGLTGLIHIAIAVAIPEAIGLLTGYVVKDEIINWYQDLKKPSWTPPNAVFPITWTVLYAAMGVASYLVYRDGNGFSGAAKLPLLVYAANLALNALWTILFFKLHNLQLALIEVLFLDAAILGCILTFKPVNSLASYIMIPYLIWSSYATALNFSIWQKNDPQLVHREYIVFK